MKLANLEALFFQQLKDIYDAEKQLTRALPKMAKHASSEELADALENHLDETKEQIKRLDRIFAKFDESPGRKKCKGMEGLIEEGSSMLEEEGEDEVIDAAIIASGQKVEHYEMAAYGCLRAWAEQLEYFDVIKLIDQTLEEEKAADEKLSEIASAINAEADYEEPMEHRQRAARSRTRS